MIVYKVCRKEPDDICISAALTYPSVKYALDKISYPDNGYGPLCAFENLTGAIIFAQLRYTEQSMPIVIFKCTARKSRCLNVWRVRRGYLTTPIDYLPTGTVLCSSIRPLEVVHRQKGRDEL